MMKREKSDVIIKKIFKFISVVLIIIMILFVVLGVYMFIVNINKTPKIGTWSTHKVNNNLIGMQIDEKDITKNSATITISNNTGDTYTYGHAYTIEYYNHGKWHFIKPIDNPVFLLNAFTLEPQEKNKIIIDWKKYYGNLPVGKYRVLKEFDSSSGQTFYSSVEFSLK